MNHHQNPHEISSQNSAISNFHDENRITLTNLFNRIRVLLNHDFESISTNRSIIINLSEVLNEVRIFKNSLNPVEFGFYLAMQFFVMSFPYNMRIMNKDIPAFQTTQHQFQLSENEFNALDDKRREISDSICNLKTDENVQNALINDLQHKIKIGFNRLNSCTQPGSQSTFDDLSIHVLQHNLDVAYKKKEAFVRKIEELTLCYNDIMKNIMEGHKERSIIQSKYHQAVLKYEESMNIRTNLIEAWTDFQTFIHI
jgi:hypothetical protein